MAYADVPRGTLAGGLHVPFSLLLRRRIAKMFHVEHFDENCGPTCQEGGAI